MDKGYTSARDDQARRLHDRAGALDAEARIVEIGSFRGRSLIVLALAAPDGTEIISIDPHARGDRGPQEIATDQDRSDDDHAVDNANLARAGVADRITHVRRMSDEAHGDVQGELDLLYIDGAHRLGSARADIIGWGDRVRPGGTMLIHDSFSSIGVTLALLASTGPSGEWRYVGRSQSLAEYRREPVRGRQRLANVASQLGQLPWFARNVVIKVVLTAKLHRLTRYLGHHTRDWPY